MLSQAALATQDATSVPKQNNQHAVWLSSCVKVRVQLSFPSNQNIFGPGNNINRKSTQYAHGGVFVTAPETFFSTFLDFSTEFKSLRKIIYYYYYIYIFFVFFLFFGQ